MIYIVGLGPGHEDYILPKAIKTLKKCDIIVGFKRALDSLKIDNCKKSYMKSLADVDKFISKETDNNDYINKNIAIVASGDPTFYGITNYIKSKAQVPFEVIPGISSIQYLTAKVKLPWNNAYLGSLHGRSDYFINKVREYDTAIWLTDKENNPSYLCEILCEEKIDVNIIVGENLSYEDEVITTGKPADFIGKEFSSLCILIIDKSTKIQE
ncbi:precorrin-6y C5,15-methyltransferase (decarboxylating) subunit CbiE [Clostridium sp. SM-530-WT-3G]|uniref:precorrin-6y C5,15-methyltransferase (decarboxylating) subunit CbiE n=1 Tax=Clostridium sp. SM-530-WT-3G TaxID=2725303 RepID=UPI00145ED3FD|nr:precorrin-6y C5,15-methyltransferase (decarboxylating) subunit CbiE [Clostridium sp. SM-530-WT-3G]NME81909.1 precorrin-6y C5,15-methyltransferase (decarboxylating) subunit CbiE [Clostridium sp. SM-530-WT-3G]